MFPSLTTDRLILDQIQRSDADDIAAYANNPAVYATTIGIAHPYTVAHAHEFIFIANNAFQNKIGYFFAIRLQHTRQLIGAIDLRLHPFEKADSGFVLNEKYWGQNYATEALKAILAFGFNVLNLNKISAFHFNNNAASGKVMQKCGMHQEGILRAHIKKDTTYIDCILYSILQREHVSAANAAKPQ